MSRLSARALAVAAGALLVLAAGSAWARAEFLDTGRFADSATDSVTRPAVRDMLAAEISERVIAQVPGPAQAAVAGQRALVEREVAAVIESDAFRDAFHTAVTELHAAMLDGTASSLELDLSVTAPLIGAAVGQADPRLEQAVAAEVLEAVEVGDEGELPSLEPLDRATGTALWGSGLLGLAAIGLGLALHGDRWRTVTTGAVSTGIGGAALVVAAAMVPGAAAGRLDDPGVRDAVEEVVRVMLGSLRITGIGLVALAAAVTLGAWVARRRAEPAGLARNG